MRGRKYVYSYNELEGVNMFMVTMNWRDKICLWMNWRENISMVTMNWRSKYIYNELKGGNMFMVIMNWRDKICLWLQWIGERKYVMNWRENMSMVTMN